MVCSKWRQRAVNASGLDTYIYGHHHTLPPALDYYDAGGSVGGCSRTRSQHDLCAQPGVPQWIPQQPGRDCPPGTYATSLEMRRIGSAPGRYVGYSRLGGGSQLTIPDAWAAPCPVHGFTGTNGRRQHIYNVIDTGLDGAMMPSAGNGNLTSPFYHELDGEVRGLHGGPTPPPRPEGAPDPPLTDTEPNSDPFSKM